MMVGQDSSMSFAAPRRTNNSAPSTSIFTRLGLRLISLQNVSRVIVWIEIFLISRPLINGVPGTPVVSEFMGLSPVSTRKNSSSSASASETALGTIAHCEKLFLVRCHCKIDRFAGDGSNETTNPSLPTKGSVHIETQP